MIYLLETMIGLDFLPVYLAGGLGASMLPLLKIDQALQAQRGHLLPWVPVCLGLGIAGFFLSPEDPGPMTYLLICIATLIVLTQTRHLDARRLVAWGIVLTGLGFSVASFRANSVAAPVLSFRYYGPVEGRVIAIDRSSSDALRMTLDQLRLRDVAKNRTPDRIRISITSDRLFPAIGSRIGTTAHLMPPQGPAEPGGFDYRRYAWFLKLGANGYTRSPVIMLAPTDDELPVQSLRYRLSGEIQRRIPGETGALAAAIVTGDRSGVGQKTLRILRVSNLAHLLAISGLHMGLLTGFIYAALRFALCLVPPLALRLPVKKIAALSALGAASVYLALSGGNVATERAFVMVCVALGAVLLNRRAISLRTVAVAAILVLIRRPETLFSPGFQMSFAATGALVAVFGWLRDADIWLGPRWVRPIATVLISSAVAGLATAPFGAGHFNILAHYGLLANILAVPIMGLVVIPSVVLALCLTPFGLEQIGLLFLDIGLTWILTVATLVSALPNAASAVPSPGLWVLPLLTLGALFVILWQGRLRWLGTIPLCLSFAFWSAGDRPKVLISENGGLVGILGSEGRALSREKGQGYTAMHWLTGDGDTVSQVLAAKRWPALASPDFGDSEGLKRSRVGAYTLLHVVGTRSAKLLSACAADELVVSNVALDLQGDCRILQPSVLRYTGSIRLDASGTLVTAAELAGDRLWTQP